MAAMTEDSVVSSLNELRRMAADKMRREAEARAREAEARARETERQAWEEAQRRAARRDSARMPAAEPRPRTRTYEVEGWGQAPAQPAAWGPGYAQPGYAAPVALHEQPPFASMMPQPRSAAGPVFLTILLLGAAAGAGYWKLQQDFQATLRARDQALLAVEQAKGQAVEAAARAEQQAKLKIAALEAQLAALAAEKQRLESAPSAAPAAAPAPVVEARPPAARPRSPAPRKVASAEPAPRAADEKKTAAVTLPKFAKKKKVSDDPLAGIKL